MRTRTSLHVYCVNLEVKIRYFYRHRLISAAFDSRANGIFAAVEFKRKKKYYEKCSSTLLLLLVVFYFFLFFKFLRCVSVLTKIKYYGNIISNIGT